LPQSFWNLTRYPSGRIPQYDLYGLGVCIRQCGSDNDFTRHKFPYFSPGIGSSWFSSVLLSSLLFSSGDYPAEILCIIVLVRLADYFNFVSRNSCPGAVSSSTITSLRQNLVVDYSAFAETRVDRTCFEAEGSFKLGVDVILVTQAAFETSAKSGIFDGSACFLQLGHTHIYRLSDLRY